MGNNRCGCNICVYALVAQSCSILCNLTESKLLYLWGLFFRQEHKSGLPFPPSEDFPDAGIEFVSPALQADSLPPEPSGKPINTDIYGFILWVWGDNAYEILPQCMTNWKHSYVMDILKILVLKSLLPRTWDLVSAWVKTLHPMEGALPGSSVIFSNISIWISWI